MPVATLSHVKRVLDEHDMHAKKKFGQNFLIDANVVDKIAKNACDKELLTIEIGPGIGSLSEMLMKYSRAVVCYEIDEDMFSILKEEFNDDIELYLEDFLKVDLDNVSYRNEKINVCSNLPYYVTTPILFKLFESDLMINKITVMVQKEVADRFKAEKGSEDYNALSVIVQYLFDVKLEMNVSKSVFYPMPKVDSAVISFTPKVDRNREFEKVFFELVKNSFKQRRKTLHNNLKEFLSEEEISNLFNKLALKDKIRAQELSLADFLAIYEVLYGR